MNLGSNLSFITPSKNISKLTKYNQLLQGRYIFDSSSSSSSLTNIFKGTSAFTDIKVGNVSVTGVYVGSIKIWG